MIRISLLEGINPLINWNTNSEAQICHLSFHDIEYPYVIPVHFVAVNRIIYVHSIFEGKKIELLEKNNKVFLEIDLMTEIVGKENPCSYSTKYRSFITYGKATQIVNPEEKYAALLVFSNKLHCPDVSGRVCKKGR